MVQLKIPKNLYDKMVTDLSRLHSFAFERVGFLYVKTGIEENKFSQILATNYIPVSESNYIKDPKVGAKINSPAIREVMQRILDTGEGALHVHMHEPVGQPRFSRVDSSALHSLIPSFKAVGPKTAHGALLLSGNKLTSLLWLPGEKSPVFANKIIIVGYPLSIYRR